jgi:hexosaminidase
MKVFKYLIVAILFMQACTSPKVQEASIIPKPNHIETKKGAFEISSNTKIFVEKTELKKVVAFLDAKLKKSANVNLTFADKKTSNGINLTFNSKLEKEEYTLDVTSDVINITASNETGFFYAIQSIIQLLPAKIESTKKANFDLLVPAVSIKDKPQFGYRAMHLDVSRHFYPVHEVKMFLDYLAMYKFNKFHWHLTDDQGWRLEIKKYPLLTEKGAWRKHNGHDKVCIKNAKEDESYVINPDCYVEKDGEKWYGGFYTQEQIKEIIKYAADRQIEIIPEIDIPGHFEAATANYPFLQCPIDMSKKSWNSYPACLGKRTTYDFIKDILTEVSDLFPSKFLHIGGDEVRFEGWKKCKLCQREIKKHKLHGEHGLQSHFNVEIEAFLKSKGKTMLGWDEIIDGGATKDAVITWWRGWRKDARDKAAKNGNRIVITPTDAYYFDYDYSGTTVEKIYKYNPIPEGWSEKELSQILGVQANLWTEYIPSMKRLQHQFFPRAGAIAENAWTFPKNKNWADFKKRNDAELERYDIMNIWYHIPDFSSKHKLIAFTDSYTFKVDLPHPAMKLYYTTDGSTPNEKSTLYTKPIVVKETTKLTYRVNKGRVWGKTQSLTLEKQAPRNADNAKNAKQGVKTFYIQKKVSNLYDLKVNNKFKETIQKTVNIDAHKKESNYAMIFEGFIKVEKDGIYDFITKVDDSGIFYIGDKIVVDRGGNYSGKEVHGMIALKAGTHKFTYKFSQFGGAAGVTLDMITPDGKREKVDATKLYYK